MSRMRGGEWSSMEEGDKKQRKRERGDGWSSMEEGDEKQREREAVDDRLWVYLFITEAFLLIALSKGVVKKQRF